MNQDDVSGIGKFSMKIRSPVASAGDYAISTTLESHTEIIAVQHTVGRLNRYAGR